jgi:hypothetical protein
MFKVFQIKLVEILYHSFYPFGIPRFSHEQDYIFV